MFDLEQSIADWRTQMLAAGIQTPVPMEELESHLREEIAEQMESGLSEQEIFNSAVQQIGQAGMLKSEFAKAGGTIQEWARHFILTLSGVPNYQLATNMNTSNSNIEPGWATYFKTTAFILPAIFLWVGSCVFVLPKLREICATSGTIIPKFMLTTLAMSDFFKNHFFILSVLFIGALAILEWRSRSWPRYRRLSFGIAAFSLNSIALIFITAMFVLAVIAGSNLSAKTSPFRNTANYLSPFAYVHFDTNDNNKVTVAYNGSEYELAAIDNLPVADILDFCRRQYGKAPLGEGWAQKRFAEDLMVVLVAMKHPVNPDNTVGMTLIDPQTAQQKVIAHALMTAKNREAIIQDRTSVNSNLLQSLPQK